MFNLAVGIDSRGARRGASEVRGALNSIRGSSTAVNRNLVTTERNLDALGRTARLVGRTLGLLFAGAGLRSVSNAADAYTKLGNQIALVTENSTQAAVIQGELFALADRARAPIEEIGTLYGRAALSAKELGATQGELLEFTEGVAQALAINGSNASEARGALIQLSQALGSGIVRAEEFNSVLEGARPVLVAVADGLDVTVAGLRQLVIDGEVTSREFFDAFQSQLGNLQSQFEQTNSTIGQAGTILNNAFVEAIGTISSFSGASNGIVEIFRSLADFVRGPLVDGFLAFNNQIGSLIVAFDNLFVSVSDFFGNLTSGLDVSLSNTAAFGDAVLKNLASPFETIRQTVEILTIEIVGFFDRVAIESRGLFARITGDTQGQQQAADDLATAYETRLTSIGNVFERSEARVKGFEEAVKGARATFTAAEIAETLASTPTLGSGGAGGGQAEDDDARKAREKLEEQVRGFEAANNSALKFQQTIEEINQLQTDAAAAGIAVNQEAVNAAIQDAVNTYTGYNDLLAEGKSLTESLLTPQEEYNESIRQFTELLNAGVISEETFNRARAAAQEQLNESNQNFQLLQELGRSAVEDIQGAFTDLFLTTGQGLDDFADQFGQTLQRVAANFLANQAIQFILNGLGSFGGPLGSFASSFAGGFADGGNIPAGQVGLVGERGPEFISGPATITPMSAMPEISLNVVNVSDPAAAVEAASNTKAGDQGLVNQIGRNVDEIRRVLGQS